MSKCGPNFLPATRESCLRRAVFRDASRPAGEGGIILNSGFLDSGFRPYLAAVRKSRSDTVDCSGDLLPIFANKSNARCRSFRARDLLPVRSVADE